VRTVCFPIQIRQDSGRQSGWLRAFRQSDVYDSGEDTASKTTARFPAAARQWNQLFRQVRDKDGRGGWSVISARDQFTTLVQVDSGGKRPEGSYDINQPQPAWWSRPMPPSLRHGASPSPPANHRRRIRRPVGRIDPAAVHRAVRAFSFNSGLPPPPFINPRNL